jgi:hypothetical protein
LTPFFFSLSPPISSFQQEYLKHVILKFMLSNDRNEQLTLLPVISEMLQFSKKEEEEVTNFISRGALRRVAGGFKNLLLGPGS